MNRHPIGTCSLCGGRVSVPAVWHCTIPPVPCCESCGATMAGYGPVLPMVPMAPIRFSAGTGNGWQPLTEPLLK